MSVIFERRAHDIRLERLEKQVKELTGGVEQILQILDKAESFFASADWAVTKIKNGIKRVASWVKPIAIIVTGIVAIYHTITGGLQAAWRTLIELLK
jgi:hypothetical protein